MNTLFDFKRNAIEHNVCDNYKEKWDSAKTPKELIDIALNIQGIEFVAKAIGEGWGINPTLISKQFPEYINGNYIHINPKKYTSELFCNYEGEINIHTTNILVIDSQCIINIPKGYFCNIYLTGEKSNIALFNEGYCRVIYYNNEPSVNGNGITHIKHYDNK